MEKSELKDGLINSISHFLLNYPVKVVKRYLWDLYREWVHGGGQVDNGKEHSEMLLFYECLIDLINEMGRANKSLPTKE
jgi:hypothetical protein